MIKVLAVGKIKEKALKELIAEYEKRLSRFNKITIVELEDQPDNKGADYAIEKESGLLLKHIKDEDFVILLDLKGDSVDSLGFAALLETWQNNNRELCFVIGGSNGVNQAVVKRANYNLKLGDLTFPHQIARLLILEQIYRAYKINNKQNYHK